MEIPHHPSTEHRPNNNSRQNRRKVRPKPRPKPESTHRTQTSPNNPSPGTSKRTRARNRPTTRPSRDRWSKDRPARMYGYSFECKSRSLAMRCALGGEFPALTNGFGLHKHAENTCDRWPGDATPQASTQKGSRYQLAFRQLQSH